MRAIAILALLAFAAGVHAEQTKGPRGGCYTIVKSKKTGKEYKRYAPCGKEGK